MLHRIVTDDFGNVLSGPHPIVGQVPAGVNLPPPGTALQATASGVTQQPNVQVPPPGHMPVPAPLPQGLPTPQQMTVPPPMMPAAQQPSVGPMMQPPPQQMAGAPPIMMSQPQAGSQTTGPIQQQQYGSMSLPTGPAHTTGPQPTPQVGQQLQPMETAPPQNVPVFDPSRPPPNYQDPTSAAGATGGARTQDLSRYPAPPTVIEPRIGMLPFLSRSDR